MVDIYEALAHTLVEANYDGGRIRSPETFASEILHTANFGEGRAASIVNEVRDPHSRIQLARFIALGVQEEASSNLIDTGIKAVECLRDCKGIDPAHREHLEIILESSRLSKVAISGRSSLERMNAFNAELESNLLNILNEAPNSQIRFEALMAMISRGAVDKLTGSKICSTLKEAATGTSAYLEKSYSSRHSSLETPQERVISALIALPDRSGKVSELLYNILQRGCSEQEMLSSSKIPSRAGNQFQSPLCNVQDLRAGIRGLRQRVDEHEDLTALEYLRRLLRDAPLDQAPHVCKQLFKCCALDLDIAEPPAVLREEKVERMNALRNTLIKKTGLDDTRRFGILKAVYTSVGNLLTPEEKSILDKTLKEFCVAPATKKAAEILSKEVGAYTYWFRVSTFLQGLSER